MKFGTPIVNPAQPFIQGQVDQLFAGPSGTSGAPSVLIFTLAALNSYDAIAITNAGAINNCVYAAVLNNSKNGLGSSCSVPKQANANDEVILPIQCAPGDTIVVALGLIAASANNPNIAIYGLTNYSFNTQFRPDGRAYPLGLFGLNIAAAALGTTTVLAAPPGGFRYFIKSVSGWVSAPAAGGSPVNVTGTVNGTAGIIIASCPTPAASQVGSVNIDYPEGFLTDQATALQITCGFNAAFGAALSIIYDIVEA